MLLTTNVILVRIFAVVGALANTALFLEASALCLGGGGRSGLKNFLGEDFRGDRGKRGYSALEVVSAIACQLGILFSRDRKGNSLPVASHVALLQVAVPEGDLAGVAGVWVRR